MSWTSQRLLYFCQTIYRHTFGILSYLVVCMVVHSFLFFLNDFKILVIAALPKENVVAEACQHFFLHILRDDLSGAQVVSIYYIFFKPYLFQGACLSKRVLNHINITCISYQYCTFLLLYSPFGSGTHGVVVICLRRLLWTGWSYVTRGGVFCRCSKNKRI